MEMPLLPDDPTPSAIEDVTYLEAMFRNWIEHCGSGSHPHRQRYQRWAERIGRLKAHLADNQDLATIIEGKNQ